MLRMEAIAADPDADPLGPHIQGEDLNNYMPIAPSAPPLINAAIEDMLPRPEDEDAASHAVIDGPASAQRSC